MKSHADAIEAGFPLTWTRVADYAALTKPRIAGFVLVSTMVGFIMGSSGHLDLELLLHTLIGTAMVAGGSAAMNQYMERDLDARMKRTSERPLPSGRLHPEEVHCFSTLLLASGLFYLWLSVNFGTGLVAALTSSIYLFLYTPLKRKTTLNTVVGAVAGALPPVGGWVAAAGSLSLASWALFAIVFFWQFPHFFAIAWLHREDYARGGYRMITAADPDGRRTRRQILAYSLVLLPCSLIPALLGMSGLPYGFGSAVLSLAFLVFVLRFCLSGSNERSRLLMLASLVYLPMLWTVMIFDRILL